MGGSGRDAAAGAGASHSDPPSAFAPTEQPTSSQTFERTWKKDCRTPQDNYTYLHPVSTSKLDRVYSNHHPSTQLDHHYHC